MSSVGDELPVAWMIDGFDSDDNLHQPGIMLADVFDQLGLGIGWSRNENRASVITPWVILGGGWINLSVTGNGGPCQR